MAQVKSKYIIVAGAVLVIVIIILAVALGRQRALNEDMAELAALEKSEMEGEYEEFALQYSEMITKINNDSIVAQLTREQLRTQQLLEELRQVKADDAREIARLKKELATVRAVLRSYVLQIDSLNQLNQSLMAENASVKGKYAEAERQIEGLSTERASLSEKVAIAAQLNATGIAMTIEKKNGKAAKKIKDAKRITISYTIARNVTASNGVRTAYVRVTTPTGSLLQGGGTFEYENKTLEYSMKKDFEYTGEETSMTLYWSVGEFLEAGSYDVAIFVDGNMIGDAAFTFK